MLVFTGAYVREHRIEVCRKRNMQCNLVSNRNTMMEENSLRLRDKRVDGFALASIDTV